MATSQLYLLCSLLTLAGLASAVQVQDGKQDPEAAFAAWAKEYGKQYKHGSEEYWLRRGLFEQRSAEVRAHNADPERTWEAFDGPFADYTEAERKAMRGARPDKRPFKAAAAATGVNYFLKTESEPDVDSQDSIDSEIRAEWQDPPDFDPGFEEWLNLPGANNIPDQGSCGSCWAVTTRSIMDLGYAKMQLEHQGNDAMLEQKPVQFSQDYIIDCVPNPNKCGGTGGCEGSTVEIGCKYIETYGIDTQEEYAAKDEICTGEKNEGGCRKQSKCSWKTLPGSSHEQCKPTCPHEKQGPEMLLATLGAHSERVSPASKTNGGARSGMSIGMRGCTRLLQNEGLDHSTLQKSVAASFPGNPIPPPLHKIRAGELRKALFNAGPVGISMAADGIYHYRKGIYSSCDKNKFWKVDHAMTLMGYGTWKRHAYWAIRNSWSSKWGDKGFMKVKHSENCKMDDDNQKGIGCAKDGTQLMVCGTCGMFLDSAVPYFKKGDSGAKPPLIERRAQRQERSAKRRPLVRKE